MRYVIATFLAVLSIMFIDVGSASAEGLNGEQIKKLLIGNTMVSKSRNRRVWYFHKDASTRIGQRIQSRKGGDRYYDFAIKWRVTKEGLYCNIRRNGAERCRKNVRIEGNIIKMDGIDGGSDRSYEFFKGNPQDLKIEKQQY